VTFAESEDTETDKWLQLFQNESFEELKSMTVPTRLPLDFSPTVKKMEFLRRCGYSLKDFNDNKKSSLLFSSLDEDFPLASEAVLSSFCDEQEDLLGIKNSEDDSFWRILIMKLVNREISNKQLEWLVEKTPLPCRIIYYFFPTLSRKSKNLIDRSVTKYIIKHGSKQNFRKILYLLDQPYKDSLILLLPEEEFHFLKPSANDIYREIYSTKNEEKFSKVKYYDSFEALFSNSPNIAASVPESEELSNF
jgi:hypothetical protein